MAIVIRQDEINILVYKYLLEAGKQDWKKQDKIGEMLDTLDCKGTWEKKHDFSMI